MIMQNEAESWAVRYRDQNGEVKTTEPDIHPTAWLMESSMKESLAPKITLAPNPNGSSTVSVHVPAGTSAQLVRDLIETTLDQITQHVKLVNLVQEEQARTRPEAEALGPHERINRHGIRTDERSD
jgi:hypothetical protein